MRAGSRIASIDIVRGVAVLGIFAMNIVNFAMPVEAYSNPAAYGLAGPADLAAWFAAFILIDGKMRGLFTVLFGASLLLVVERADAAGLSPASIHYRRMAWLLVFGLLHAALIWDGDILAHYAILGMIAYAFREHEPHEVALWAAALLAVQLFLMAAVSAVYLDAGSAAGVPGASAQALARWQRMSGAFTAPGAAELSRDLALHRGAWSGLVDHRLGDLPGTGIAALLLFGCESLAYMLAGMWGLKSGFLTGAWARSRYARTAALCLGITVPAYLVLAIAFYAGGFRPSWTFALVHGATTLVRPIMIAGLAALVILVTAPGGALVSRIEAAGRVAFTNYLAASLIATTVFYGHGAGLYGRISRWELYPLVLAVWMAMLLWSKPWLDRYRYGPFEWLWRSLSRGEVQPMRPATPS